MYAVNLSVWLQWERLGILDVLLTAIFDEKRLIFCKLVDHIDQLRLNDDKEMTWERQQKKLITHFKLAFSYPIKKTVNGSFANSRTYLSRATWTGWWLALWDDLGKYQQKRESSDIYWFFRRQKRVEVVLYP